MEEFTDSEGLELVWVIGAQHGCGSDTSEGERSVGTRGCKQ